ncbi:uncharacterized protein PpBr36_10078 [Pyricularia pennisetigena]|uniref:uncharacterized protein n=1 Tax=Pyricularia pennisetigena TaxID=1578925 RepID=UPI0011512EDA|nr:uncharacterized protein PpBr36_10078 [Pyricularia pennisetigena]TLS22257.1 hypothetical protein PpBr36_10078 [Pyricularia pennisetigena]
MHLASFLIPYLVAGVMAALPTQQEPSKAPQGLPQYNDLTIKRPRTPVISADLQGEMGKITLPTVSRQPMPRSTTRRKACAARARPGSPATRHVARALTVSSPKSGGGSSGDGGDSDSDDQPNPKLPGGQFHKPSRKAKSFAA